MHLHYFIVIVCIQWRRERGGRGGRPGRHFAVGGIRGAELGILAFVLINFIHQAVEKYNETNINDK